MSCYNISSITWVLIIIFVGTYGAYKNFKAKQMYTKKNQIYKEKLIPKKKYTRNKTNLNY